MTSASMTFGRPSRLTIPRGSLWFGSLAAGLIAMLRRLDQWELSRRREPQTADEVMAWANSIESTQPGFASDLRSAALRSMSEGDRCPLIPAARMRADPASGQGQKPLRCASFLA